MMYAFDLYFLNVCYALHLPGFRLHVLNYNCSFKVITACVQDTFTLQFYNC